MKTVLSINKSNQKYSGYQQHTGIYCKCPNCNGNIVYGMVSCPDEKNGCLVAHYNYGCEACKNVFNIKFKEDKYDDDISKLIIFEEIGPMIINIKAIEKLGLKNK